MAKVNVQDYSKSRPVIAPTDFPRNVTVIPFTIAKVEHTEFDSDGEKQKRIVLVSEEHGDKVFWLNVTGIKSIVARLGDDDEKWVGQTIPLVRARTNNPQSGKQVEVLWVAAMDDDDSWDAVMKSAPRRGAKKTARRR